MGFLQWILGKTLFDDTFASWNHEIKRNRFPAKAATVAVIGIQQDPEDESKLKNLKHIFANYRPKGLTEPQQKTITSLRRKAIYHCNQALLDQKKKKYNKVKDTMDDLKYIIGPTS
tara:strand:- start:4152 stop:4499 length:348 start_codon:yes stop_codon:yes gene_type:complete